jgi:hypothetical protein
MVTHASYETSNNSPLTSFTARASHEGPPFRRSGRSFVDLTPQRVFQKSMSGPGFHEVGVTASVVVQVFVQESN